MKTYKQFLLYLFLIIVLFISIFCLSGCDTQKVNELSSWYGNKNNVEQEYFEAKRIEVGYHTYSTKDYLKSETSGYDKLYYKIKNGLIIIIYFDNEFIGRISYNINNYEIKILGEK